MPIVSSQVSQDGAQTDGRRWTHEAHTDQLGLVYGYDYLAAEGLNVNTVLATRATDLAAQLTANEITANVTAVQAFGSLAAVSFNYSTMPANRSALRTAYQTATQMQAVMIGDFLSGLTDPQLQTAFGLTAGQVTSLRTNRLTPAANTASAIRASVGQ